VDLIDTVGAPTGSTWNALFLGTTLRVLVVAAVIAFVVLMPLGFALVERRRISTPLVFQCRRCGQQFQQPPHRPFPRTCGSCGARDWSRSADRLADRGDGGALEDD
jgi:hypothetical protein